MNDHDRLSDARAAACKVVDDTLTRYEACFHTGTFDARYEADRMIRRLEHATKDYPESLAMQACRYAVERVIHQDSYIGAEVDDESFREIVLRWLNRGAATPARAAT